MTNPDNRSNLQRLLGELRRRHVVRTTIAYAAVVFVVLQLAEIVIPAFFPGMQSDAILRLIVVGAVLSFPILVALAWIYEITPQGVRSMAELDADAGVSVRVGVAPRVGLLVITLLAASGAGLWWWTTDTERVDARQSGPPRGGTEFRSAATTDIQAPVRSVAVLALDDLGGVEGDEYFVAAMHEALISNISQVPGLRVISRTSVLNFDARGLSLPQIGEGLGVDAIIEGSVLRVDGEVRVTVQLIHAASDTHLWAESYERSLESVITVQREIAEAVREEVARNTGSGTALTQTPSPRSAILDASTAPAAAQEALLRGRFALSEGGGSDLDAAARRFAEALEIDSTFAPALVGLATVEFSRSMQETENSAAQLAAARQSAQRAVDLDPESEEAREVLASISLALSETGSALLGPRQTELGRLAEREMGEHMLAGRQPGPEDRVGGVLRLAGGDRLGRASELAAGALEDDPTSAALWEVREQIARVQGDMGEVLAIRRGRAAALGTDEGPSLDALATALRSDGVQGYWRWKLENLQSEQTTSVFPSLMAAALLATGDTAAALDGLEASLSARDRSLVFLRVDPVWDPVRDSPRFEQVMNRLRRPPGPGDGGR